MLCGLLFFIVNLCVYVVIFMPSDILLNILVFPKKKSLIFHLSLAFLYCSANHTANKQFVGKTCHHEMIWNSIHSRLISRWTCQVQRNAKKRQLMNLHLYNDVYS